ncbi:MAG: PhoH family protein [Flavobacteriales bacterium]
MTEVTIDISGVDPIAFYGSNDDNLNQIKNHFPKVQIIGRSEAVKLLGEGAQLEQVKRKIASIIHYLQAYNNLTHNALDRILWGDKEQAPPATTRDILIHGAGGIPIQAQTHSQRKMVLLSEACDMVFAVGPSGTGKTYMGVTLAVRALKHREVRRIVLTRPAVAAGEHIGFLPGDPREKLDPYLQPLYDALRDMIPADRLLDYIARGTIQIAPLGFMRGRTLDHAFVILDEAQNTTHTQMKMFLTRMGKHAKFIITGDPGQIDLPTDRRSGLLESLQILSGISGIGVLRLDARDVLRHRLVKRVLKAYEQVDRPKKRVPQ